MDRVRSLHFADEGLIVLRMGMTEGRDTNSSGVDSCLRSGGDDVDGGATVPPSVCGTESGSRSSSGTPTRGSVDRHLLRLYQRLYVEFTTVDGVVWDMAAHVSAKAGRYEDAARAVEAGIGALTRPLVGTAVYPSTDVVIARERVKLAQLWLSAGRLVEGGQVVRRAEMDLCPVTTADDPDVVEIGLMKQFLSRAQVHY